jgi:hypothetical protein
LPCQKVGYTINQTQTPMSLIPIELDRTKYAVGQIVHIFHIQNNSDTKNVTKYSESSAKHIVNVDISQIPYDSAGENVKEYLEINRTHYPSPSIILGYPSIVLGCYEPFTPKEQDTFALIELDNLRSNYTFIPNQPGLYVISTYSTNSTSKYLQEKEQQKEFKTIFEVINPVKSATFIMLIIAIGFFIAIVFLTFILSRKNKILNDNLFKDEKSFFDVLKEKYESEALEEIYPWLEKKYQRIMYDYIEIAGSIRFFFISAFVWSLILALVFTEVEIGTQSPLGLVLRHNLNPEGNELDVTKNPLIEWGINIGGNWENNFSSGVVIPFYVFILGLVGGYLRYLQKTTSKEKIYEKKEKPIEGTSTEYQETKYKKPIESTSLEFQETTYGELSNIFLAPLLAAVIWFIISQGETEFNIYGMAAISFSIGLVTKEIIQIIVKFMERIVPPEK